MTKKARTKIKPIPIELDEKHELRMNMAAIADIHEHAGVNLMNTEGDTYKKLMEPKALSVTVWALMGGPDSGLSIREVQKQLTMDRLEAVTQAVMNALSEGNDNTEPEEEKVGGSKGKK